MTFLAAIKIIILGAIFVLTGGFAFYYDFRKNLTLTIAAIFVSLLGTFYLGRSVYDDLRRDIVSDVIGGAAANPLTAAEFGWVVRDLIQVIHEESGTFPKDVIRENFPSFIWSGESLSDNGFLYYFGETQFRFDGRPDISRKTGKPFTWEIATIRNHPSWGPYIIKFTRDSRSDRGGGYILPDRYTELKEQALASIRDAGISVEPFETCGYQSVYTLSFGGKTAALFMDNGGGNRGALPVFSLGSNKIIDLMNANEDINSDPILPLLRHFIMRSGIFNCSTASGFRL